MRHCVQETGQLSDVKAGWYGPDMDEWTVMFGFGSVILTILAVGGALAGVILAGQVGVKNRFDDVNRRFDDVNHRFDDVNRRFDDVNRRIDSVEGRLLGVEERLRGIETGVAELRGYVLRRNDLFPEADPATGAD